LGSHEGNTQTPLTSEHGYPVRAIVPGLYGMMNPKWITEIELVDNLYEGYWARNGWTNIATEDTHSFIVIPGQAPTRDRFRNLELENINIVPGQKVPVAGIAFAGDRGISKVEVSTDGGATWKSASIKDPLSKYTWVLWTAGFTPAAAQGNYTVIVRATDKRGKVQTAEIRPPFPDGVWHSDTRWKWNHYVVCCRTNASPLFAWDVVYRVEDKERNLRILRLKVH